MSAAPSEVFARRVKAERERAGLTQPEFAARLSEALGTGIDGPMINRIERVGRKVKIDEAVAIAHVLGVALEDLLHDRRDPAELRRRIAEGRVVLAQAEAAYDRAVAEAERHRRDVEGLRSALQDLEAARDGLEEAGVAGM